MSDVPTYNELAGIPNEYHASYTFVFNELLDENVFGFDDTAVYNLADGWEHYTDAQATRVLDEIAGLYGYREIGITPLSNWVQAWRGKMQTCATYANALYKLFDEDILQDYHVKERERTIGSEFPQTMLSYENADYASTGRDYVREEAMQGSVLAAIDKVKDLKSIDELFIDAVDPLFIHLFAPIVNGW